MSQVNVKTRESGLAVNGPPDVVELKDDVLDMGDRLYTVEERLVRLTNQLELMHEELDAYREGRPVDEEPVAFAFQELDTGVVRPAGTGPWMRYLDAIQAVGPVRQRQVLLLPGMWSPYGLTASEIAHDINEIYPDHQLRVPNAYPLVKAMLLRGLLVEHVADDSPSRYTVNTAT